MSYALSCLTHDAVPPNIPTCSRVPSGEPRHQDAYDTMTAEIATFNLFTQMKYDEGVEGCERVLIQCLSDVKRRLEMDPSPRSLSALVHACRTLYSLAHKHSRFKLKVACADMLLADDGRWKFALDSTENAVASTTAACQESKDAEDVKLLENALARSKEAVTMLQAQCDALKQRLQTEKQRRKATKLKCQEVVTVLQRRIDELDAAVVHQRAVNTAQCSRLHVDDDPGFVSGQREVSRWLLFSLFSAACIMDNWDCAIGIAV